MNIKDLKQGSYKVVNSPTNINQLQPGSFRVLEQTQSITQLQQKTGYQPTFEIKPEEGYVKTVAKTLGNIPKSAWEFGKGIISFLNPVNTIKTLAQIPGEFSALVKETGGVNEAIRATLGEIPQSTYETITPNFIKKAVSGDIEGSLKSITENPVGEIAPILLIARAGAKKLGKVKEFDSMIAKITKPISEPITKPISSVVDFATRQIQYIPQKLEQINLRLTPTQKVKLSSKMGEITKFVNEKIGVGTPESRFKKIDKIYYKTEETLANTLKENSVAKGTYASKSKIISELEKFKKTIMKDSPDAITIEKQVQSAIDNINSQYKGNKIPISRLNTLKRNTFKNAYNQAGTKVLSDVEWGIGDILRENLYDSAKNIKIGGKTFSQFNNEYSTIITARDLLKKAQGKSQIGLIGNLTSRAVGGALGSTGGGIGTAFGVMLGGELGTLIAGTPARSFLAKTIQQTGKIKIPTKVKTIIGNPRGAITTGAVLQKK